MLYILLVTQSTFQTYSFFIWTIGFLVGELHNQQVRSVLGTFMFWVQCIFIISLYNYQQNAIYSIIQLYLND